MKEAESLAVVAVISELRKQGCATVRLLFFSLMHVLFTPESVDSLPER